MAQTYGLGNFLYTLDVADGNANFKFWDTDDASNTAEVSVAQKDFPEGIKDADSRQVADLAFEQCQKVLNDKRDARLKKETTDALAEKQKEDARVREEAADVLANGQDVAVAPAHIEKDGTKVYNTAPPEDQDTKKK
jgi:hypothetical protein